MYYKRELTKEKGWSPPKHAMVLLSHFGVKVVAASWFVVVGLVLANSIVFADDVELIDLFSSQDISSQSAKEKQGQAPATASPKKSTAPIPSLLHKGKSITSRASGYQRENQEAAGFPVPQHRWGGRPSVEAAAGSPPDTAKTLGNLKKLFARFGIREQEEPERFYGKNQRPTAVWMPAQWAERLPLREAQIRALREQLAELRRRTAPGSCLLWPLENEYLLAPFPEISLMLGDNAFSRYVLRDHDPSASAERLLHLAPSVAELFGILDNARTTTDKDVWKTVPDPVRLAFADGSLVLAVADWASAFPELPLPAFTDGKASSGNHESTIVRWAARRVELAILAERLGAQMGFVRRLAERGLPPEVQTSLEVEAAALRADFDEWMSKLDPLSTTAGKAGTDLVAQSEKLKGRYLKLRARIAALPGARNTLLSRAVDASDFLREHIEIASQVCLPIWRRIRLHEESSALAPEAYHLLFAGLERDLTEAGGRCRLLAEELARLASAEADGYSKAATVYLQSRISSETIYLLAAATVYYLRSAQRIGVLAVRVPASGGGEDALYETKAMVDRANQDIAYALRSQEVTNEPEGWLDPPRAIRLLFEWHRQVRSDRPEVLDELRKGEQQLLLELMKALRNAEVRLHRAFEGGAQASCRDDFAEIESALEAGHITADRASVWRRAVVGQFVALLEQADTRPYRRAFLGMRLVPLVEGALRPGEPFRLRPSSASERAVEVDGIEREPKD